MINSDLSLTGLEAEWIGKYVGAVGGRRLYATPTGVDFHYPRSFFSAVVQLSLENLKIEMEGIAEEFS